MSPDFDHTSENDWRASVMKPALIGLLVVVAISVVLQAVIFYLDRDRPQQNVVLEKRTSAIITLVESGYDTCSWRGRTCSEIFKDQKRRDECLQHVRTRAQNFNAANSTLKLLGDNDYLARVAELTIALMTYDLGGSSQQSDQCTAAVDQFVNFIRSSQRFDRLSGDLLARLREKRLPIFNPTPESQ
jgi:hypothetical protein